MQTTNPLLQISSASPTPAPARANSNANANANANGFSQTLNQSMNQAAQRQAPQAPAAAAPKAAQPHAKPHSAPADKAPANRPNVNATNTTNNAKPAQASQSAASKPAANSATADDAARDAAAAAEAAATTPVVDMLALVASFNQPLAAKAGPASASVAEDAVPVAADTLSLIDPAVDEAIAVMNAQAALAGAVAQAGGAALDRASAMQKLEVTDTTAQTGDTPGTPAQPGGAFAAAMSASAERAGRTGAQEQFSVKDIDAVQELQPESPSAPGAAPLQQGALAQAVANAASDKIAARVGTTAWDNQVSQKIVWMVAGGEQTASLTLNPPDLGPMQVVLSVNNDHADVTFSAAQPEVRQALEDAMPRLREMLSESGLSLGNASVNADLPQERQARSDMGSGGRGNQAGNDADTGADNAADNGSAAALETRADARAERTGTVRSMVDTFV